MNPHALPKWGPHTPTHRQIRRVLHMPTVFFGSSVTNLLLPSFFGLFSFVLTPFWPLFELTGPSLYKNITRNQTYLVVFLTVCHELQGRPKNSGEAHSTSIIHWFLFFFFHNLPLTLNILFLTLPPLNLA